ncbi:MAG: hypothetical protein ABEI54_01200, partial [Candidatus Bipolaricaulia bacterium]
RVAPAQSLKLARIFSEGEVDVVVGTPAAVGPFFLAETDVVLHTDIDKRLSIPRYRSTETVVNDLIELSSNVTEDASIYLQVDTQKRPLLQALTGSRELEDFMFSQLGQREDFDYPPFARMITITFTGSNRDNLQSSARSLKNELLATSFDGQILGPARGYPPRLRGAERSDLIVKAQDLQRVAEFIKAAFSEGDWPDFVISVE